MQVLIVGGNFGNTPKESSIVNQLADGFLDPHVFNGGDLGSLNLASGLAKYCELVIWMPNVDNAEHKVYPQKDVGSVLIVSKVLRENRNEGDAVSRIFTMHANAVISIDKSGPRFKFRLLDALGNLWGEDTNITNMAWPITKLYKWSSKSTRIPSRLIDEPCMDYTESPELNKFIDIIKVVADKVENERGGRYFGNASTRCSKMFPSMKMDDYVLVSGRSVPKDRIEPTDFIPVRFVMGEDIIKSFSDVGYLGEFNKKPSVDTPIQLRLYNDFPQFNYMIHGHAYIENVSMTENYFPCGDMREYMELYKHFANRIHLKGNKSIPTMFINLKNHGFIILSENLTDLEDNIMKMSFKFRELGETIK